MKLKTIALLGMISLVTYCGENGVSPDTTEKNSNNTTTKTDSILDDTSTIVKSDTSLVADTTVSNSKTDTIYEKPVEIEETDPIIIDTTATSKPEDTLAIPINPVIPEMIEVEGGTFSMGNSVTGYHNATVSSFYIGKYEVTQKEWLSVIDSLPNNLDTIGENFPIDNVSLYEAMSYCNKLSISEGLQPVYTIKEYTNPDDWYEFTHLANYGATLWYDDEWKEAVCDIHANGYRVPTESEWEYVSKGGVFKDPYEYSGSNTKNDVAFSDGRLHEVGGKLPNALGVFDMSGNVDEMCWDIYANFPSGETTDYMGPNEIKTHRVLKGYYGYNTARSSYSASGPYQGLRVVRSIR